jgi:hypothetical protein
MLLLKHSRLAAFATRPHVARTDLRRASRIAVPFQQPAFPVVEFCPSPTCPCRESPAGLDIDRETMLNGSIGTYAEQVLIATGRSDWKSRIEEDEDAVLLQQMKGLLGRGGKYSDVRQKLRRRVVASEGEAIQTSVLDSSVLIRVFSLITMCSSHIHRFHPPVNRPRAKIISRFQ